MPIFSYNPQGGTRQERMKVDGKNRTTWRILKPLENTYQPVFEE
jgi:hypothetical protein